MPNHLRTAKHAALASLVLVIGLTILFLVSRPGEPAALVTESVVWMRTGDRVPVEDELLDVGAGPEHCGLEEELFLSSRWDELGVAVPRSEVVPDPSYRRGPMTSTALPDEAFNTEFHSGDVQLWVTPDAADVYLVGEDRIERWEADSGACA